MKHNQLNNKERKKRIRSEQKREKKVNKIRRIKLISGSISLFLYNSVSAKLNGCLPYTIQVCMKKQQCSEGEIYLLRSNICLF